MHYTEPHWPYVVISVELTPFHLLIDNVFKPI